VAFSASEAQKLIVAGMASDTRLECQQTMLVPEGYP